MLYLEYLVVMCALFRVLHGVNFFSQSQSCVRLSYALMYLKATILHQCHLTPVSSYTV